MGVVFYQIMADEVPDESRGKHGVFQKGARSVEDTTKFVTNRRLPVEKISGVYHGVEEWLLAMVEKDRTKRPVPATLLEYEWFNVEIPECNGKYFPPQQEGCFAGCSLL